MTFKRDKGGILREEHVTSRLSGGLQMEERPPPNNRIKPRDSDLGRGKKNRRKKMGRRRNVMYGNHPQEELELF